MNLYTKEMFRQTGRTTRIVKKFPAALYVDGTIPVRISDYTAQNIIYDTLSKTTQFEIEKSSLYNPFDIVINEPQSLTINETSNNFRNFYSISSFFKSFICCSHIL